jgi:hypothetical protein
MLGDLRITHEQRKGLIMAKKKWSFNAFVAGKNLKGSNKICDIGIEMDMRLCADADILIY